MLRRRCGDTLPRPSVYGMSSLVYAFAETALPKKPVWVLPSRQLPDAPHAPPDARVRVARAVSEPGTFSAIPLLEPR